MYRSEAYLADCEARHIDEIHLKPPRPLNLMVIVRTADKPAMLALVSRKSPYSFKSWMQ